MITSLESLCSFPDPIKMGKDCWYYKDFYNKSHCNQNNVIRMFVKLDDEVLNHQLFLKRGEKK